MNFSKDSPKSLLLLILVLGLALRSINLTVGFPMLYLSNDEAVYHLSALNMIAEKTPFSLGNYGPLGSYIQIPLILLASLVLFVSGKVASFEELEFLLITQDGYFMLIPRALSAMFGVLTILVIYKISLTLFKNKNMALWSAFFTAVSFNLVHISHFARSLSPALFFTTLTVFFAVKSAQKQKDEFKNILISFISSAIAFGFHQVMGIIIIFTLAVSVTKPILKNFSRSFVIPIITWIFMIILMNYLSLGNNIVQVFRSNNNLGFYLIRTPDYWLTKNIGEVFLTLAVNIKMFWYLILAEGLILLLAIYGFFKEKAKSKHDFFANKIRSAFVLFFLTSLFLSIFVFPPLLRYFLPTIVFLPLFAGVAAYRLLNNRTVFVALFVILSVSFNSLYWNWLITRESTFAQMRTWIDTNLPADTPIGATFYRTVGYVPSKTASAPIRESRPGYYQRAANLLGDNSYPYNVRNILYLEAFGKDSKVDNLKTGLALFPARYIIDAYYKESERLLSMTDNLQLVARFSPTGEKIYKERVPETFADVANNFPFFVLSRPGPYFDVLKFKQ